MRYPTYFYSDYNGEGIIFPGHGWPREYCLRQVDKWDDAILRYDGENVISRIFSEYFYYVPRIKWCNRKYGLDYCDWLGDWHHHWIGVQRTEDPFYHYTVVYLES